MGLKAPLTANMSVREPPLVGSARGSRYATDACLENTYVAERPGLVLTVGCPMPPGETSGVSRFCYSVSIIWMPWFGECRGQPRAGHARMACQQFPTK